MITMDILLQDWDLPPFDKIKVEDYEPAVRTAIEEAERNIEAIIKNTDEPTFENTVEALERASRRLDRVSAIMVNLNECCTSEALQEVVMKLEPEITRFSMKVMTDRRLYERVSSVQRSVFSEAAAPGELNTEHCTLNTEQRTLLENTLKAFVRHGVALEGEKAERYRRNEEELTALKQRFSRNALADQNAWTLHLTDENDLTGLPQTVRDAARAEAEAKGLQGWLFTLAAPSYIPFMTYSERRDLREKMYRAYGSIGGRGNENDNNEVIRRIVELRAEQARLLGYDSYCDYVLEDRMVQSLPNLRRFMQGLKDAVLAKAQSELTEMLALTEQSEKTEIRNDSDNSVSEKIPVMPWDVSFLSEKLKRQRYDLDSEVLRPYFPLDAVREGIFALYGRLYGLRFEEDPSVPVYHEDVHTYRVYDGEREMGLLYLDMHPRESKRSGAWMTEFRGQSLTPNPSPGSRGENGEWKDVRPQIQVVCNFSKPTAETPALLRFSEVETFMHEMGHAMHGMLSEVRYESLSGTNVKRDFVEMPSQVMENWCYEPEFLGTFARHWQTGEPLPMEYIDKIRAAQNHMAGWLCLRQLNLGYTDIAFHGGLTPSPSPKRRGEWKAEDIEAEAMTDLLPRVPGCSTATNFSHIFSGGYASGYYGYKWAEVLDADIFSRFKEDGIFNKETATAFRREILSRGGSEHPAVLFKNFMGREPDNKALLKRMNLL